MPLALARVTASLPVVTARVTLRSHVGPISKRRGMATNNDLKAKLQELQKYSACDVRKTDV
jgi:hypothetical protein